MLWHHNIGSGCHVTFIGKLVLFDEGIGNAVHSTCVFGLDD